MKKVMALLLFSMVFIAVGCNNSGKESSTTNTDTASHADTIKSDPSKFSDPH